MADGIKRSYAKPQSQPQRAGQGATLAANNKKKPNSGSTNSTSSSSSKFYSSFLFKALVVAIISLVVIPYLNLYFPSSSASDANSSPVTTRAWELFHMIFVGIAVSYGLFSRKNRCEDDASDLDNNKDSNQCTSKFDNAQSYMSKLLQVSSVFEDDNQSASSSFDSDDRNDNKKVQTWSSQYHRNKPPMLVVAEHNEVDNTRSVVVEKPLLLPVRSLKSRVSDDGHVNAVGSNSRGFARSYSSVDDHDHDHNLDDGFKGLSRNREDDSDSIRRAARAYTRSYSSPIAKGSSSDFRGTTASESQIREDLDYAHGDHHESLGGSALSSASRSFPNYPVQEDHDHTDDHDIKEKRTPETVVLPSPIPWRSRSGRILFKPDLDDSTISPSLQNSGRSQSSKSLSSQFSLSQAPASSSSPIQLSRTTSVPSPKKLSPSPSLSESKAKIVEDVGRRKTGYSSHLPPPPPPPPPPPSYTWRLVKNSASQDHDHGNSSFHEDSVWGEHNGLIKGNGEDILSKVTAEHPNKARDGPDANLVGKSVRTFRSMGARTSSDTAKQELTEDEQNVNENPESKNDAQVSKSCFAEFAKETRDFLDEVLVHTDEESDSEDDTYAEVRLENESLNDTPSNTVSDEGPDVDKKADEFIAKFREQIRLQRIESIKRSAGQLKRTAVR